MSNWYFCKNGQQEGPITLAELKGMIASGDLAATLPVWESGTASWIKVYKHPDLISSVPTPPPLPVSPAIGPPRPTSLSTRILTAIRGSAIKSLSILTRANTGGAAVSECLLVQHLKRISQSRIATNSRLKNIAAATMGIIEDIRNSKISDVNINYLVDLLPALYEQDDTDLLRRHLDTDKPDCLICAAIEARLARGIGSAT